MSNWADVSFRCPRHKDRELVELLLAAIRDAGVTPTSLEIFTEGYHQAIPLPFQQFASAPGAKELFESESVLLSHVKVACWPRTFVNVKRTSNEAFDTVSLHLTALNSQNPGNPPAPEPPEVARLVHSLKKHLHEITSLDYLNLLGNETQKHFEQRESNLARLEDSISTVVRQFTVDAARVRSDEDARLQAERQKMRAELDEERVQLQSTIDAKRQELVAQEEALQKRLAEVDAQASRHARRKIREDLKAELANRATKFELTAGTRALRKPISAVVVTVLLTLLVGLLSGLVVDMDRGSNDLVSNLRLATVGLAFASTFVFYLRWQNRWFEQHAQEEFRLKRMALDVDRASWVVEMAMEWKDEKEAELPAELLTRLCAHLFEQGATREEALHPADQLASALLGSASELSVELPGGKGALKVDRRGIRDLQK